jgi:hypothetical protein
VKIEFRILEEGWALALDNVHICGEETMKKGWRRECKV